MHRLLLVVALSLSACTCKPKDLQKVPPPEPETCNGIDDDFDGYVDEGLGEISCGDGACKVTVPSCTSGKATECVARTPVAELCNGFDDNCDGQIDEGLDAIPELCNGADDNCNGETDEGLSAIAELCNGADDNCDGQIDEGLLPATCGVGECSTMSPTCVSGSPVTCEPLPAGTESCNGKDDDCDGTVDEDLLTNTSGDLRITNNNASSDQVYIAKGASGFGIVWADGRVGTKDQIYFAELTNAGTRPPGNTSDRRVSTTGGASRHPALAWDGVGWGLLYADDDASNVEIYFQKLNANGTSAGSKLRLTNATGTSDWPDVVWTGSNFGVAYQDSRGSTGKDIYFQRVDSNGNVIGTELPVVTLANDQTSPILKWNGTSFALAWTSYETGSAQVQFRLLNADGSALGNVVTVAPGVWPDLTWNDVDHQWALVWHAGASGNAEVFFTRLAEDGTALAGPVQITNASGDSAYASIDWNGFQYGLSWQDTRGGNAAIYFTQVSAVGIENGDEVVLSSGTGVSDYTTALWNGSTFAFCWRDSRNSPSTNTEIYFATVGCAP